VITALEILEASILIVDDQQANVVLLEQMLRGAGYLSVASTRDPLEVWALHRKHRYSLILLDLQMPGMDGFQVMEGLKEIETGGYLPVLVITAQPDHKLRALKAGARDFISKPFDFAEVFARVHNLIEVRLLHVETKRLYEQVVAEQKVSQQQLLLFRSGPVAMSIDTVADARIIDVNEQYCRFFGCSREEMVGHTVLELKLWANPADRGPVMERLSNEGAIRGFEIKKRKRSGEVRDVLASLELIVLAGQSEPVLITMFTDITERKQAEAQLRETHKQLVALSRVAGMAEIATNVLHNVGNVLNSVNVSASLIVESVKNFGVGNLNRVVALMRDHSEDLADFITKDSRGKHLPAHLAQLSEHLTADQEAIVNELDSLRRNVDHIKEIVSMQQTYARVGGVRELIDVIQLVEDSLRMTGGALSRHGVEVTREFVAVPPMNLEKHKILQILLNLLNNAKYACDDSGREDKRLTVRVADGDGRVRISVIDNGVGIPPENLARIFGHGFTTRKDGHGFGLHSGALAAREMGGSLTVQSEGTGNGAVFTLELPCGPGDASSPATS
jgi:PAS domain S-box-containing protein